MKLCLPTTIPALFITIRREDIPSLNKPDAKYDANSTIFSPECKCLGANLHFVSGHLNISPVSHPLINLYILEEFPSVRWGAME
ncbi:hypothetical protein TNIN_60851 [Trichonephila inaurata madagascariensis]|uniref:Uncharacterized protein n=1 Tax=Trichonephila inaurata madagascariensis TaxID=2747483 RepID=A0A8X7BXX7_9ARAC|nr:hypothetical protein TNIN_197711 [Trichonephila inaurata madagascariensis]GFY54575.1 hypothetical protein TNIN_276281 [Trichonephila inaurata madagascariensis]GFY57030.1 hypothetical protein TNIN_60851 [Trichonephila inaurata madagascariensis]